MSQLMKQRKKMDMPFFAQFRYIIDDPHQSTSTIFFFPLNPKIIEIDRLGFLK